MQLVKMPALFIRAMRHSPESKPFIQATTFASRESAGKSNFNK
jgi:hypothetical protein